MTANRFRFRAKAVDPQYGLVVFSFDSIGNWIDMDGVFYVGEIPCFIDSIQQSTGLTDKNGKEIFEGDIVTKDGQVKAEVRYVAPRFVVVLAVPVQINALAGYGFADGGTEQQQYLAPLDDDCEVIGNLHENPNLLK